MATILDYVCWRGDLTFQERRFNEVDNLILATLAYVDFTDIVPKDMTRGIRLKEVYRRYIELEHDQSSYFLDPFPLLKICAMSRRYQNIVVKHHVRDVDTDRQVQFSAVTFVPGNGHLYVGICGTDDTIIGWREDFNFSYMNSTQGQEEAKEYLNRTLEYEEIPIIVGGHSKGGNLAIYAAAFCTPRQRDQIVQVYSNDGPGFHQTLWEQPELIAVKDKTQHIIPQSSVIGVILANKAEKKIIKSKGHGLNQHNPYNWKVSPKGFLEAKEQTKASKFLDEALNEWIGSVEYSQREEFVSAVFDAMTASGMATLSEMNSEKWRTFSSTLTALLQMEQDRKKVILKTLKALVIANGKTVVHKAKRFAPKRNKKDGI